MRIAYLLAVHRDPELLRREILTLRAEESTFFVHVDQKADFTAFSSLPTDDAYLTKERIPVYWGEFSQVRATMLLMREALEHSPVPDYLLFLTGSTYPLRSGSYIRAFLEENRGSEFMSMVKMPAPGKPISRIDTRRFPSDQPLRRTAFRALAKFGLAQRDHRKHLRGLEPYSGGASWALSKGACEFILDFIAQNPYVEKYFENTFAPDEMFFQTILGNSAFKPNIRRDLLYDDWSFSGPHPGIIEARHIEGFAKNDKVWIENMYGSCEALFARKFSDSRLDLVDLMDNMIRLKEGGSRAV